MSIAAAGPAQAGGYAYDRYVCEFDGRAGNLNPGVESIQTDLLTNTIQDQDHGTYDFGGDGMCVFVDSKKDDYVGADTSESGIYEADIVSFGHYHNTVCGTGTEHSDYTVDVDPPFFHDEYTTVTFGPGPNGADAEGPLDEIKYDIEFVAGNGALDVSAVSNGDDIPDGSGHGAGYVNIIPEDTDGDPDTHPCVDEDVKEFTVDGAFELAIPQN